MKRYRILSLGAGVQSTTIALMVHRGELPAIDAAVFADPQEESDATYVHLKWLVEETKNSFQTIIRTRGKLGDDLINGNGSKSNRFATIPAFQGNDGVLTGLQRRQCTSEYKTNVVEKTIKREIVKLKHGQRFPSDVRVTQIIGLSFDEPSRLLRVRDQFAKRVKWADPEFPLFQMQMTRKDCQKWLLDYGVPHEVPRSACSFCPYHSNEEWNRIKTDDPQGWKRAVEIDEALRTEGSACNRKLRAKLWLHRSCVPLAEADLRSKDERIGQTIFSFDTECHGMCGN